MVRGPKHNYAAKCPRPAPKSQEIKWSRATDALKASGYDFSTHSSMQRLEELLDRAKRGLISYEKRTPKELRQFCKQRKLDLPEGGRTKKAGLIAILESADEDPSFKDFQVLPAELRVRIYEIHIWDVYGAEPRSSQVEPPITMVTRLLRQGALPVFYDTIRVTIGCNTVLGRRIIDRPPFTKVNFHHSTAKMLKRALDSTVSRFTKLHLEINVDRGDLFWNIDLAGGKKKKAEVRLLVDDLSSMAASQEARAECEKIKSGSESMIRDVLEHMTARDGDGASKSREEDVRGLL